MGYAVPKAWIFEPSKSTSDSERRTDDSPSRSTELPLDEIEMSASTAGKRIPVALVSVANEPAVIMDAYLQLASTCPMAWDSVLYQSRQRDITFAVNDMGALWSPSIDGPSPGPLRYHAYFALATSALALLEPSRYPLQLHLKYLQTAVAEMRRLILQNSFSLEDLLHGISKTLLASVLQGDFDSARAHLVAAASIVTQQGGIHMIDGQIAATLRYADFQLAVESLRAPAFPPVTPLDGRVEIDTSLVDPEIVGHAAILRANAAASNGPAVVLAAIEKLLDGAMVLAHGLATSKTKILATRELHWIASHTADTIYMLLAHCTSVLQKHTLPPGETGSPGPTARTQEWVIILLMWSQLLICFLNETIGDVTIRTNTVPILHNDLPSANAIRTALSDSVRKGLQAWNDSISCARAEWREDVIGHWVKLIDIAAETERARAVQFAPFMRRLLAIRNTRRTPEAAGRPGNILPSGLESEAPAPYDGASVETMVCQAAISVGVAGEPGEAPGK